MIDIRLVQTIAEARHIEEIIVAVWGGDYRLAVPDHLTITIAKENGGVALLAWDDDQPVGFCLGFLSFAGHKNQIEKNTIFKLCSHMTAVLPNYRNQKIGERLKWAQREAALATGLDLITWTYDPLETLNGRLNIHKLGAACNTYKRNVYGTAPDDLNWGSPTDRFRVDWHIDSTRVNLCKNGRRQSRALKEWTTVGVPIANPPLAETGVWRAGAIDPAAFDRDRMLTAVPRRYQAVKKASIGWGLDWRLHTRELFEAAFAQGFTVVDLIVAETLCYYLLEKNFNENRTD